MFDARLTKGVEPQNGGHRPLIISTWPFGKPANDRAWEILQSGGSALDAVEQGIRVTETGENNRSVGLQGQPNAAGFVQLDACIMDGATHRAGSVAGLEGIVHPISVARRVMEKTPHVMLVGRGARRFALAEGFESVDVANHEEKERQWEAAHPTPHLNPQDVNAKNHDTIALLVLTNDGQLAGGCSTSGLAGKLPGRVGDSPIIGSGLYVDKEVGAAGATGVGENVMRFCGSFLVVEFMRSGLDPMTACQKAIERIAQIEPPGKKLGINFIAIDKQGRFGAAGTDDFPFAITYSGVSEVRQVPPHSVPSRSASNQ